MGDPKNLKDSWPEREAELIKQLCETGGIELTPGENIPVGSRLSKILEFSERNFINTMLSLGEEFLLGSVNIADDETRKVAINNLKSSPSFKFGTWREEIVSATEAKLFFTPDQNALPESAPEPKLS